MHETQARIQPEDVEEVPETANTLKHLKSAQGYGFSGFARVQKLIFLEKFAFGPWSAQESVDFLDLEEKVFGTSRTQKNFQTTSRLGWTAGGTVCAPLLNLC